jgi:DNA-binding NarL/FixJ family response regulator
MNAEPVPDSPVDVAHLDALRAHPSGLRSFIGRFLTGTPPILQELEQSMRRRDKERVENLLHALSGSALNAGAQRFARACQTLARHWEDRPAALQPVVAEFEIAQGLLHDFLAELPTRADAPPRATVDRTTVLLVEDHPTSREFVHLALEEDYQILEACDGREAMALFENESPDIAIVDLNLGRDAPECPSGLRLLQLFKDQLPAIVLTVDRRPPSIQSAIQAGAWAYLFKPQDPHVLHATIEAVLARSRDAWDHPQTSQLDLATGWLMASFPLDREEARQALIAFATEQRRRSSEVARDILAAQCFRNHLGRFIRGFSTSPVDAPS